MVTNDAALRATAVGGLTTLLLVSKFVNDAYLSFLAPLLPFIASRDDLSLAAAGSLASVLSFTSMVPQPLFGIFSRKWPRIFLVLGPLAVALGTALILLGRGYWTLIVFVVIAGTGAAAFNPIAAALAGEAVAGRRGLGLGLLTAAGQFGRCIGPIAIIALVARFGIEGGALTAVAGITVAVLVFFSVQKLQVKFHSGAIDPAPPGRPLSLGLLWLLMAFRAAVIGILTVYLPLLLYDQGYSLLAGSVVIAALQLVGASSTLLGGRLSDRLGRRQVILGSFVLAIAPLFFAWQLDVIGSIALLVLGGGILMVSLSVTLTLGQELFPTNTALVSGILTGLGWGIGSLAILGAGLLADRFGLREVLSYIFLLPVIGSAVAFLLPRRYQDHEAR